MIMFKCPMILEAMNCDELDYILFDAEHGVFDTQNVVELLQVCRLMGLPAFVRAQDSEYHLIAKAIDMGADGVMLPRTERLEQLRTAVDALLFYPEGRKGDEIPLAAQIVSVVSAFCGKKGQRRTRTVQTGRGLFGFQKDEISAAADRITQGYRDAAEDA